MWDEGIAILYNQQNIELKFSANYVEIMTRNEYIYDIILRTIKENFYKVLAAFPTVISEREKKKSV